MRIFENKNSFLRVFKCGKIVSLFNKLCTLIFKIIKSLSKLLKF